MEPGNAEREHELFAWFNRHRDRSGPEQLAAFLTDRQLRPGWRDLVFLGRFSPFAPFAAPEHVASFFARYALRLGARRILDPFGSPPVIAAAIVEAIPGAEVIAISPSPSAIECGRLLAPAVDWRHEDGVAGMTTLSGFDLVVGSPPIRQRATPDPSVGGALAGLPASAWRSEQAHLVLALASHCLKKDGKLIALLGEGSIFQRDGRQTREWLAGRGVFFEASLSIAGGLYSSAAKTQVSIFGADRHDDLFLARITPAAPTGEIVDNLCARTPGAAHELGVLVDDSGYLGWESAMAQLEAEAMLVQSPHVVSLADVTHSVERIQLERGGPDPDDENTIYLPEMGMGPARTYVAWGGNAKTRRLIALRLDPTKADAEYFAHWLNGPGDPFRRSIVQGTTIERVSAAGLGALRVPLPPLPIQRRNAEFRRQVIGLRAELGVLEEQIAQSGSVADLKSAEDELQVLLAGDDLDAWINRLPFPIAAVLHRYRAQTEAREQLRSLLHFFEGMAVFCATLLLSVARRDQARWALLKEKIVRGGPGGRHPLQRATFGAWVNLGRTVAKALREPIDGDESPLGDLFGVGGEAFGRDLTEVDLWDLLERAGGIRNRQAHGGNVSPSDVGAALGALRELLGGLQERFGSSFEQVVLILPGGSSYDRGIYRFPQVGRLRGPNPDFVKDERESVQPLNHDSLYVVDRYGVIETAIELIPLVRLFARVPGANGYCLFFDQLEGEDEFRFISFTDEAVGPIGDQRLAELMEELRSAGP